ncbi:MAG: hypothetical protein LBQ42_04255 [Synergistaceae bacterium]|jgi:hypothetical protein|nr:hypothetical protein [Synergistaceae bacterium]
MDPEFEKVNEETTEEPQLTDAPMDAEEEEEATTEKSSKSAEKKAKGPGRKKNAEATPPPEADTLEPEPETPEVDTLEKAKTLVLVGAGSFTGRGVKGVRKGQPFETDSQTAERLLATGMFVEEKG